MVTALSLMRGAASSAPLDQDVRLTSLAKWLAHQRAVPIARVEAPALAISQLVEHGPLEGARAPYIIQPRGALWLIGKLGGRVLLHIFPDQESAVARGQELAAAAGVSLIVVAQDGELTTWRAGGGASAKAALGSETAPTRAQTGNEPAAHKPAGHGGAPPSHTPELPLEVRRHTGGWAVMLRGRVIATAPTREKARARKQALAADPDFVANPRPVTTK